jgi:hypothetical protein
MGFEGATEKEQEEAGEQEDDKEQEDDEEQEDDASRCKQEEK